MRSTTLCPKCTRPVAVPQAAAADSQVRCPLCQAEFVLSEAGGDALPELIVIGGGATVGRMANLTIPDDMGEEIGLTEEQFAALTGDESPAPTSEPPLSQSPFDLDLPAEEFAHDPSAPSIEPDHSAAGAIEAEHAAATGDHAAGDVEFDFLHDGGEHHHADEDEGLGIGLGDEAGEGDDGEVTGIMSRGGAAAMGVGGEPAGGGTATLEQEEERIAPIREKCRRGSPIGRLIGIVVFGFIGLAMGYGVLKLFKHNATQSIDEQISKAWASVSSLWSSKKPDQQAGKGPTSGGSNPVDDFGPQGADLGKNSNSTLPGASVGIGGGGGEPAPSGAAGQQATSPPAMPTSPIEPPNAPPSQPPTVASPTPVAAPPTAADPSPFGIANFTVEQGQQRLDAVRAAAAKAAGAVNGETFRAASDLGQALALLENPSSPQGRQLREAAADMLRDIARPETRETIGVDSHMWMFSGKRPATTPGVLLVGRVEKVASVRTPSGDVFETLLSVQGKEATATVSVLSRARPDFHVHDKAGILGTIVTDPTLALPWYTGHQPQVVLSGMALKLGEK